MMPHRPTALVVCACFAAGCAADTRPDDKHLREVDALLSDREGGGAALASKDLLKAAPDGLAKSPAGPLSLDAAMANALSRNLALVASAENTALAQIQLAQAGLLPNPTVGQAGGFLFPIHPAQGIATAWDAMVSTSLNGFLLKPTKEKIGGFQRMQAGIDLATQAFGLVRQVQGKYRDAVLLEKQRKLAEANAVSFSRAAAAARARLEAGIAVRADVMRAEAQAAEAVRQAGQAQREGRRARRELNFLMGFSDEPGWTLPADMPVREIGLDEAKLVALAKEWRLDLRRARFDKDIAAAGVKLAKLGMIPQVALGVDYGRDNSRNRYWGPSVNVGLPIFDTGRVGKEQALAIQRMMDKTYVAADAQVQQDVQEAVADYANAVANADNYRKVLIPQQEEATRLVEESWAAGVVDFETWLSALRDLAAARANGLSAESDAQHALVALEQAVGLSLEQAQKKAAEKPAAAQPVAAAPVPAKP